MTPQSVNELYDRVLSLGLERLSMAMGIVSHIDNDSYQVMAVQSDSKVFVAGETFPLENTYCRQVVEECQTVALTELGDLPGLCKHPLYIGMPLEAYISTPIYKNGDIWGTLNFSSMKIRDSAFSEDEIEFVEESARAISEALTN